MDMRRHDRGFTLLEVIIVLAIMGGALVMYTNHVRKESLKTAQQNIANALVMEMKGVVNFLHDDPLPIGGDDTIENPLYHDPATLSTETNKEYKVRLANNINDINTDEIKHYFLWGDSDNANNQQRYLFISKNCSNKLKSEMELSKEYLSCKLSSQAKNSAAIIKQVGFAAESLRASDDTIARVDVIVAFEYTTGDEKYHFVDYAPAFAKALNNSGLIASHMMLVHRSNSTGNWLLVTQSDNKTPIELNNAASNMAALTKLPKTERFGVRFTFDMNDNSNGGSGGGGGAANTCWDSENSKVIHCFDQKEGTSDRGEDAVLALTTKPKDDPKTTDPAKIKTATLNANLIMENTSRRVYIFKRKYGGALDTDSAGQPKLYAWKDNNGVEFAGEYYLDDNTRADVLGPVYDDNAKNTYTPDTYDAYELVTPAIVDYIANRTDHSDISGAEYEQYDDGDSGSVHSGALRYPVQVCPKLKQIIILRDQAGEPIIDNGKAVSVEVERRLFPRMSVSVSSASAFPGGTDNGGEDSRRYSGVELDNLDKNKSTLDDTKTVGVLGGITTQVEIVEQNTQDSSTSYLNPGGHLKYNNHKYIWAITNMVGMYDMKAGVGVNVENSADVSYTVTRWCSTIPQTGSPADLIDSYEYE
ncbi:type II secretion system protein [Pseudocitrobacter sp. RIT415]|nr:type II secretion system protein [Pseudocitrobacter sp. RIT 415]